MTDARECERDDGTRGYHQYRADPPIVYCIYCGARYTTGDTDD